MRRQATLTSGSGLLCGLDILMAPVIVMMGGFAADAPNPSATMVALMTALMLVAGGSVVCGIVALVAGLLGAPRRFVLWTAALRPIALVALFVVISVATK
jgi:hypothetical protein